MRILFLCHAFNSLSQRLFVELSQCGHEVSVEFDINDAVSIGAVESYLPAAPDLIIAPFLKRAIPATIWQNHTCLIIHPGIVGDRGPSALDWAILRHEQLWGVTVLQANGEMDGGAIWASCDVVMRTATKAGLYRNEVSDAAVIATLLAVERYQSKSYIPIPLHQIKHQQRGQWHALMTQAQRRIDWQRDTTATVLNKLHAADGSPGVADQLFGREWLLFDAHPEPYLRGTPGALIARSGPAICRATCDGAVWIGHMCDKAGRHPFKLPATRLLSSQVETLPEISYDGVSGYRDIWYEQIGAVGYLHFDFYNGAMGTAQCERLRAAFTEATQCDTRVIVLMGGHDYWSNGMHLNLIEAATSAADESWANINAIDDLALALIECDTHVTIAALQGNAGAGGLFLARAADRVYARTGVVLNPHYKDMGNLFGSEYWTYLLPRFSGSEAAARMTQARLPMGCREAMELGLIDRLLPSERPLFQASLIREAESLAQYDEFSALLTDKRQQRTQAEQERPLVSYREQELERMYDNFYGLDPSYHIARYNFVYKVPKSRTPLTIARHRRLVAR